MGNKLDTNDVSLRDSEQSSINPSLSVSNTNSYFKMNGCFMFKIKKLKVSDKNMKRISKQYPDLDLSQLQLMLSFRGQQFILQTLKKDFLELNQNKDDSENSCNDSNNGSDCGSRAGNRSRSNRKAVKSHSQFRVKNMSNESSLKSNNTVRLTYDTFNNSINKTSASQIQQDDIFQINGENLKVGEEFTFQLVSINIKDEADIDPDQSVCKQVYETLVLAQRKVEVQKLIQSNMLSMSVNLSAASSLTEANATNLMQSTTNSLMKSQIVTEKEKKAQEEKKDKMGSLKFNISFMRGKYFEDHQLSKVLLTESEQMRQQLAPTQSSPKLKNNSIQNQQFTIRHISSSAPVKKELDNDFDDVGESDLSHKLDIKGLQPQQRSRKQSQFRKSKTYERVQEADQSSEQSDDDQENVTSSNEFGLQQSESSRDFFELKKRAKSPKGCNVTLIQELVTLENMSDDDSSRAFDTDTPNAGHRRHKTHTLVQRYNDIRMPKSSSIQSQMKYLAKSTLQKQQISMDDK